MNMGNVLSVYLILAMYCCVISGNVYAQDAAKEVEKTNFSIGFISIGGANVDIVALNNRLVSNGLQKFQPGFLTIGGGGLLINDRTVVGGEMHGYIRQREVRGRHETRLSAGYGVFDIGYVVYQKKNFRFYPLLGMGGSTMTLQIDTISSPNFNGVLANPSTGSRIEHGSFLADASANLQFKIPRSFFRYITLKVGAKYATSANWRQDDSKLADGPEVGLSGGYFQLQIGF